MRIHSIVLIPGAGHSGPGVYDRGHVIGNMAEVDLVDIYVRTIVEEFENSLLRHRVVPTRKAPGTHIDDRYDEIFEYELPVLCKMGWNDIKKGRAMSNFSSVYAGEDVPLGLAREVADVMRHWGQLYVHGHRTSDVIQQKARGLTLVPFQINGHEADSYAKHLDKLGRDLGKTLVDLCRLRKDGAAIDFKAQAPMKGRQA